MRSYKSTKKQYGHKTELLKMSSSENFGPILYCEPKTHPVINRHCRTEAGIGPELSATA